MQSRLAASLHPFFASSGLSSRSLRDTVSLTSIVKFFGSRRNLQIINTSIQSRGISSASCPNQSSAIEDDDSAFSELGPDISENSTKPIKLVTEISKPIKLVTEKRGPFVRPDPRRRDIVDKPLASDTRPSPKDIISNLVKTSQNSNSNVAGHKHVTSLHDDNKKISSSDTGSQCSVLVTNIVSTVGLSELVEALSRFGKVSGASFSNEPNGLRSCNIKFENADSTRKAISAGGVVVGSEVILIQPVDAADVVSVRIENINEDTTDYVIHSKCKSVGEFVGLSRTSKGVVDAYFNVKNATIQLSILQKLNSTTVDRNRWSAHVFTSDSTSSESLSDQEASYNSSLQIFDDLKRDIFLKRTYLEDLESLTSSIMYLKSMPPITTDVSPSK